MLPPELNNLLVIVASLAFIIWLVRICAALTKLSDLRIAAKHSHVVQLAEVGHRVKALEFLSLTHLRQLLETHQPDLVSDMRRITVPFAVNRTSIKAEICDGLLGLGFTFSCSSPCSVQLLWGVDADFLHLRGPMDVLSDHCSEHTTRAGASSEMGQGYWHGMTAKSGRGSTSSPNMTNSQAKCVGHTRWYEVDKKKRLAKQEPSSDDDQSVELELAAHPFQSESNQSKLKKAADGDTIAKLNNNTGLYCPQHNDVLPDHAVCLKSQPVVFEAGCNHVFHTPVQERVPMDKQYVFDREDQQRKTGSDRNNNSDSATTSMNLSIQPPPNVDFGTHPRGESSEQAGSIGPVAGQLDDAIRFEDLAVAHQHGGDMVAGAGEGGGAGATSGGGAGGGAGGISGVLQGRSGGRSQYPLVVALRHESATAYTSLVDSDGLGRDSVICQLLLMEFNALKGHEPKVIDCISYTCGEAYKAQEVFGLDDNSPTECTVCFENPKTTILLPCRHFCICETCFAEIETCPICRSRFTDYVRID